MLWHGWLPALAGKGVGSPWSTSTEEVVTNRLEWVLGSLLGQPLLRSGMLMVVTLLDMLHGFFLLPLM